MPIALLRYTIVWWNSRACSLGARCHKQAEGLVQEAHWCRLAAEADTADMLERGVMTRGRGAAVLQDKKNHGRLSIETAKIQSLYDN